MRTRNRIFLVGCLFVLALLLAFISGRASANTPDQLARGAQMFKIWCEPCHGDQGQG